VRRCSRNFFGSTQMGDGRTREEFNAHPSRTFTAIASVYIHCTGQTGSPISHIYSKRRSPSSTKGPIPKFHPPLRFPFFCDPRCFTLVIRKGKFNGTTLESQSDYPRVHLAITAQPPTLPIQTYDQSPCHQWRHQRRQRQQRRPQRVSFPPSYS
jgi:hypothetical protein